MTHVIATLRTLIEVQKSDEWFTTTTHEVRSHTPVCVCVCVCAISDSARVGCQRDLFYTTLRDLEEEVRPVLVQYHRKLNNFVMSGRRERKKSAQGHLSPAQLESTPFFVFFFLIN